jgi:N-acetylglutamate synthase
MLVRHLEELTLNAWPALTNLLYDGWVLSFSNGYTRRANSIHPLYPSTLPLTDKIAICETTYAARGQETVFKLTHPGAQDSELDTTLERLGYASAATTSVQIADLNLRELPADPSITVHMKLEDVWFEDFNRLSVTPERFRPTMRRLLNTITPAHAFASMSLDGQSVALGLAVAERGYVGLFDIIVDASVRNQGLGRRLVTNLLHWGRQQGATHAYLAVMCDNAPALRLYAHQGFTEAYEYWYRHKRTL